MPTSGSAGRARDWHFSSANMHGGRSRYCSSCRRISWSGWAISTGAIAANRRLIERAGVTTPRIANLATLLLARGDYQAAYDLLQSHRGKVSKEDEEYWRLLADLALQLQLDADAEQALRALVDSGKATPDDFSRLIALLYPTQPDVAGRLAELAYEKFKTPDFLIAALTNYSDRRDFVMMRRIFSKLTPEMESVLVRIPRVPGHTRQLSRGDRQPGARVCRLSRSAPHRSAQFEHPHRFPLFPDRPP